MAKYETRVYGDLNEILSRLDRGIMSGSYSASLEDGSYCQYGPVQCAVRVYERYSVFGGNRLSLTLTLVGTSNDVFVSAIASGGSQAVFFKINTLGEEAFLEHAVRILEGYQRI
ncbi:MAG: DUF6054 family protein [Coriobacteriia bacterium]|nr:DUF6054 family protein [Coriobacteriia bacterium]